MGTRHTVKIMRAALVVAQKWKCFYCGYKIVEGAEAKNNERATLDHKHPLSKGGANTLENCVAACGKCNFAKGDMSAEDFIILRGNHTGRGLPLQGKPNGKKLETRVKRKAAFAVGVETGVWDIMTADALGDRMKSYEKAVTSIYLDQRIPIYVRIDGRSFSRFTRGFQRPFDPFLTWAMRETCAYLVKETNARIGYVQSDEISLIIKADETNPKSAVIFDGKLAKITSVVAGMASARFATLVANSPEAVEDSNGIIPCFDCRAFNMPDDGEAANMLVWRYLDATRNAIQGAAYAVFGHKTLMNMKRDEMLARLIRAGHDPYKEHPPQNMHGTFCRRETYEVPFGDLPEANRNSIPEAKRPANDSFVTRARIVKEVIPHFNKALNRVDYIFSGVPLSFQETYTNGA